VLASANAHATPPQRQDNILHLLDRITFGPSHGDIEEVQRIGINAYIEQQLDPANIPMPDPLQGALGSLKTTRMSLPDLMKEYYPPQDTPIIKPTKEAKDAARKRANIIFDELRQAKLMRAIYSPTQLQELMVDFWFNHFNVFHEKNALYIYLGSYERDAIRPYALGKFRQLLEATARHPAMLQYLDNWVNSAPGAPDSRGGFKGLNENYAREIMELHTMGVDGGYTQQDVTTLARIFTGWGLGPDKYKLPNDTFAFNPKRHDFSDKIFLGHLIKGSGMNEAEQAMDILARHPSTAHHISYELAQYFVADKPPESLVKSMAATFLKTDGDIRAVMRTMLHSREFWSRKYDHNKFKQPLRYVVSALRATAAPVVNYHALLDTLNQMGQPLYHYLTPDGYPNTGDAWLNSDALLKRIDFARQLVGGRFARENGETAAQVPLTLLSVDDMLHTLGGRFSPQSRKTFDTADPKRKTVLILTSPEFLYY
jgi:uncharacterized protein (DUF1800 family)